MIYLVIAVLWLVLAVALLYAAGRRGNVIYLGMAILWSGLALIAFIIPTLVPNVPEWSVPIGWFALLLVAYDAIRWWLQARQKLPDRRLLRPVVRHPSSDEPPDPEFHFREGPPP